MVSPNERNSLRDSDARRWTLPVERKPRDHSQMDLRWRESDGLDELAGRHLQEAAAVQRTPPGRCALQTEEPVRGLARLCI